MAATRNVAVVLLGLVHLASAVTQTPALTTCSSSTVITFSDVTASNVKVGDTLTLGYTIQIKDKIDGDPELVFTMTSGSSKMPCLGDVGSCNYDLCGATGKVEKQIATSWDNKCPIPAGTYTNSVNVKMPLLAGLLIKDNSIHVKMEPESNGEILGCVEFDLDVE
ncbi:hypothetical protein MTO96_018589 [Rhipicephalus appendiculatus]